MVLTIVHRTSYEGDIIKARVIPNCMRFDYPSELRSCKTLRCMMSNNEKEAASFRGCCHQSSLKSRTIVLDERHFAAYPSWDLYAAHQTIHTKFSNDSTSACTTATTEPIIHVQYSLVPHTTETEQIREYPNWKFLGACHSGMIRLAIEENIRKVLPSKTTKSSPSLHLHLEVFTNEMTCLSPRSYLIPSEMIPKKAVTKEQKSRIVFQNITNLPARSSSSMDPATGAPII